MTSGMLRSSSAPAPRWLHLALKKCVLAEGVCKALPPHRETRFRLRYPFSWRYEANGWPIGPAFSKGPPRASARGSPSHPKTLRRI